jgi:uncharacterized protein
VATASREFQVFVKPISAVCNLDCRYCYYLDKRDLYPHAKSLRMPDDLLEEYIVQHIRTCPIPTVLFSWHGGEPTILGLDYFRRIVELQRKHRLQGREIVNGIQTNGLFIDEEWCRFLADEGFYVGLSLDGPRDLHDGYRVTKGQKPTHEKVVSAFRLFQRFRVHCDILCVVHNENARRPLDVYHFFKEIGVRQLVFLPLVMRNKDGEVTPETVPAQAYGDFLSTIFDEWVREDIGLIYVQMFEEASRPARGLEHSLCVLRKVCGELPVLEHNGDFYSCDHFVDGHHLLGNLREKTLLEILEGPQQQAFGANKWNSLPRCCRQCKVVDYCNGGCPKDRFIKDPDGKPILNYLCEGMNHFFTHARPTMRMLASYMQTGQPLGRFADIVRSADAHANAPASRNDLCPCGSGKKYKRCCLGKLSFERTASPRGAAE